jgi:hypothetical protein
MISSLGVRNIIRKPLINAYFARYSSSSTFLFPPIKTQSQKPDVSLLIADLKVTPNGEVKVVEFGHGIHSGLEGYAKVNDQHQLIKSVWQYFSDKRNLPVFYVDHLDNFSKLDEQIRGLDYINQENRSFNLPKNELREIFDTDHFCHKPGIDQTQMEAYKGLIVDSNFSGSMDYKSLLTVNSNLLMLNDKKGMDLIIINKFFTNKLFSDELSNFRPRWLLIKKKYTETLAENINNDLNSEKVIIKPLIGCKGNGITVVKKEDLDSELKNMLIKTPPIKDDNFWAEDKEPMFLVEEYVESKPIQTDNGLFDATLRMVFAFENSADYSSVHYFDGYWKLPKLPMGIGSLNDHSKSLGSDHSHKLSNDDRDHVISKLNCFLPNIYEKMITTTPYDSANTLLTSPKENERLYGQQVISTLENLVFAKFKRLLIEKSPVS